MLVLIINYNYSVCSNSKNRCSLFIFFFNFYSFLILISGYSHCWKCKTKAHDGKSCEELQSSLDNSIIPCPQCGVSLAKADGCNSVTCFCGLQFGWTEQKKKLDDSALFLKEYPENPTGACIQLLTTESDGPRITLAQGWRAMHPIDIQVGLMRWFLTTFPSCPAQVCANPPTDYVRFVGQRDALKLYKDKNPKGVHHCESQTKIAVSLLFPAMFPAGGRALAALSMLKYRSRTDPFAKNPEILRSARQWANVNKKELEEEELNFCLRSAGRFLNMHGRSTPSFMCALNTSISTSIVDTCTEFVPPGVSNEALTYTFNNTSVQRVSGVSCYPAAFVQLISSNCKVSFEISSGDLSVNYMSFGLCRVGFAKSSSDGFGRTRESWGVCDNRNTSASGEQAFVGSSASKMTECRKFITGDVITLTVDTSRGWLEFDLNFGEFVFEFEIPPTDDHTSYQFGATFANDHMISIIPGNACADSSAGASINAEQTLMLRASVKALGDLRKTESKIPEQFVALSRDWAESIPGSKERFDAYKKFDDALSGKVPHLTFLSKLSADGIPEYNWDELFGLVCWGRLNTEKYDEYSKEILAMEHMAEHLDSAAYMSAEICQRASSQGNRSSASQPKDLKGARAFMVMFPEQVHEWYDYNDTLEDPILPKSASKCKCLPRHNAHCPSPFVEIAQVACASAQGGKRSEKKRFRKGKILSLSAQTAEIPSAGGASSSTSGVGSMIASREIGAAGRLAREKRDICFRFAEGECLKGASCRFSHN